MLIYALFGHVSHFKRNQPSSIDSRSHKLSNDVLCAVKGQVLAEKITPQ